MKKFFLPVLLLLFLPGVIFHASASPQAEMKGRPSGETVTIQPTTWYYHPGDTASDPLPPDTSPAEPEIAPEPELAAPVEPSKPAEPAKTAEEAPAKPEPPARNRPFVVFNEG
ncbi:MAG: hypothetical protein LBP74_07205, partial [Treponema sp.]|nr:hypothetical protein [Treponema sp.]